MKPFFSRLMGVLTLCLLALWAGVASASTDPAARQEEIRAAWKAAGAVATKGPAHLTLKDQASLELRQGMAFVPATEGARVMRALGNVINNTTFVGLVVSVPNVDWMTVIDYHADGYVRDDDAKDWNADDLLTSLKDGTEEANKDRVQRGFPELEVVGWVEAPAYDASTHRLVWSVLARHKGDAEAIGVNYNTNALGRNGHFSLNLLTSKAAVAKDKLAAWDLLNGLVFNPGDRYEDFNASTDHVAAYGLAALLGVVAVKKLGLLAGMGLIVAKFAKVIFLAVAGFGAAITRFLGGKKAKQAPTPATVMMPDDHPAPEGE
jgi:uncharacterized membrane-anchored protein